jgi:hypothetical protein
VLLLIVAILGGATLGLARPALGARSVRVNLGHLPLLVLGAAGTAAAQLAHGDVATLAMGLSLAVLAAFAASNLQVTGMAVIAVGLLVNLVAVVLNNGMPVRGEALVVARVVDLDELPTATVSGPRHLETADDGWAILGDVIPVPPAREVVSFGDLIVVLGAFDALREVARRRRRPWSAEERSSRAATLGQLDAVERLAEGGDPSDRPALHHQHPSRPRAAATIDLTGGSRASRPRPLASASTHR